MKRCSKCKSSHNGFHKDCTTKDGLCSICKVCKANKQRKWRAENPGIDMERKRKYRNTPLKWLRYRLGQVHSKIDPETIDLPSRCPVFGTRLLYGESTNPRHPNNSSIDRLDNSKGYVRGNVWIISRRANVIKSDANWQELMKLARTVRQRQLRRSR